MQTLMPDSPRSGADSALGDYIQPTFGHALRLWWAFYWPTLLISVFLLFWVGVLGSMLIRKTDIATLVITISTGVAAVILPYIVAIFIMQYILHKNFRHFRLGLRTCWRAGEQPQPLEPKLARTLRVWWTYVWRTFVYYFVAWIVVMLPLGTFLGIISRNAALGKVVAVVVRELIKAAVALYVIYSYILDEDMGDFRVCLLPREPKPASLPDADPAAAKS